MTYEGIGSANKWERIETFGGKLVENIVQATSRDILCHSMQNLDKTGFQIVMHVHDEVVIEAPQGASLDEVCSIMAKHRLGPGGFCSGLTALNVISTKRIS